MAADLSAWVLSPAGTRLKGWMPMVTTMDVSVQKLRGFECTRQSYRNSAGIRAEHQLSRSEGERRLVFHVNRVFWNVPHDVPWCRKGGKSVSCMVPVTVRRTTIVSVGGAPCDLLSGIGPPPLGGERVGHRRIVGGRPVDYLGARNGWWRCHGHRCQPREPALHYPA